MAQQARTEPKPIPFIDVAAQRNRLGALIDEAIARVTTHCQFILGPEVRMLETALAQFCGARQADACARGPDGLVLVLMARGFGPGDAGFCPAFTFWATAEVAALLGATPVFADIDEATFNIDPASLERAIAKAKRLGLKPKAVIPVDLFGLPADHDALAAIASAEGLFILDDAAQSFGADYKCRPLGKRGGTRPASPSPRPLARQEADARVPSAAGGLPVSERFAHEVISPRRHAYLDEPTQDRIIDAVHRALTR